MVWVLVECTFLNSLCPKRRWVPIILVVLTAHHIPTSMSCNSTLWISLMSCVDEYVSFEYWCGCFSKIIPHLENTLKMDWLHHYTTLHTASNTNGLLQHSLPRGVFVKLLISKVSHEVILWLPLQMTLILWLFGITVLKIFMDTF
jgi:hypothetical protein